MKKRFGWSESFLNARDSFTTPEVRRIAARCQFLIKEFESPGEAGNEGYRCSQIAFEECDCGFVLRYSTESDIWVLHLVRVPPHRRGTRRRAPRASLAQRVGRRIKRAIRGVKKPYKKARAPKKPKRNERVIKLFLAVLHRKCVRSGFGQVLAAFAWDIAFIGARLVDVSGLRNMLSGPRMHCVHPSPSLPVGMVSLMASMARPLVDDVGALARLEPRMIAELSGLPILLSTYGAGLQRGELSWDASVFGALPDGFS